MSNESRVCLGCEGTGCGEPQSVRHRYRAGECSACAACGASGRVYTSQGYRDKDGRWTPDSVADARTLEGFLIEHAPFSDDRRRIERATTSAAAAFELGHIYAEVAAGFAFLAVPALRDVQ